MSSTLPHNVENSWQDAWNSAQDTIARIRDDVASSSSPSPRITRVGKVDAELLDAELVQVLKEPLTKALSLVDSAFKAKFDPELTLFIHLVLYKLSVWDHGASYGAKLQGLKYAPLRALTSSGIPRTTLALHSLISIFFPYFHTRLRAHALSNAWPDAPSSDRRRKIWELLTRFETLHGLLALLNFIVFLKNGRFRTLADRIFGLRLVPARRQFQREVSYEFMNRQMVWHAFTEFLLFLLPLINTRAIRRQVSSLASRVTLVSLLPAPVRTLVGASASPEAQSEKRTRRGKYWSLPSDHCAICADNASTNLNFSDPANALTSLSAVSPYTTAGPSPPDTDDPDYVPQFPIHSAYVTSCGHVYCYYCLTERMMRTADERSGVGPNGMLWECLRCTEAVFAADRLEAEAEGPEYESGVDDDDDDAMSGTMSFDSGLDTEFTDMSGSVGSFADSEESGMYSD
ncbi:peroxisomal biogenesis factor 2 [Dichomitus squalens]|uniref:RING-type E3 ubiquitin transferase (cysteine targeting) n=1 Tax=Dichomitus squalens TaxID=114155 RepID=A0A4Q9N1X2_9APHY|nr:peroxisomal biogenesis factor 2 [Dichomitus squalens]